MMDEVDSSEGPGAESLPSDDRHGRPPEKVAVRGVVGALIGPIAGILYSQFRVGPKGFLWWPGKNGGFHWTPRGRFVFVLLFSGGAIVGALCGMAIDAWEQRRQERATDIRSRGIE